MRITTDAWLVDTNVILRWSSVTAPEHADVTAAVEALAARGRVVCVTAQNLIEFWNVATRPVDRNGLGLPLERAAASLARVEGYFQRLPDSEDIYPAWRRLVMAHGVSGVQVHDARLAACMQVHGIAHILTFNTRHFRRYPFLTAVDPANFALFG